MTIHLEYEADRVLDFDYEEVITKVINEAMDYENCPYEAEVEVVLTGNEAIHRVNKEFRDIDRATDVLSFPMVEYAEPGKFEQLEEQDDCFHPETGELLLGDIMISVDKVYEQAREYGHSEKRELAFLIAHSMLHLFGYDHMEDLERERMEQKQEAILSNLGITR